MVNHLETEEAPMTEPDFNKEAMKNLCHLCVSAKKQYVSVWKHQWIKHEGCSQASQVLFPNPDTLWYLPTWCPFFGQSNVVGSVVYTFHPWSVWYVFGKERTLPLKVQDH